MGRRAKPQPTLDTELAGLPPELRWRTWMGRVEAVLFASPEPATRENLSRLVGAGCALDELIDDIKSELKGRPYELVKAAGGWQLRTRAAFAEAVRAAGVAGAAKPDLSRHEAAVLMAIAYLQPIARGELSIIFGKEVSRDTIAALRADGLIAAGPRSPTPGAPYAYVTTRAFLAAYGFDTLRDLPDLEQLEDAGLLDKAKLIAGELPEPLGGAADEDANDDDEAPGSFPPAEE